MKKVSTTFVFVLVLLSLVILPLSAGGSKEATGEKPIVLRYSAVNPETHPVLQGIKEFARIVSEKSKGRITIQLYAGGQLGDQKQNIQNLQMGALDMAMTQAGYLVDFGAKKLSVIGLPYIFRDDAHVAAVLNGAIGNELLAEIQKSGTKMVGLGFYPDGFRHFFFAKKKVSNLADLKGLKVRVQPGQTYVDLAKALNVSPTPMPFSELYAALQTGVVDGADQPLSGFYANKYQEISKNITLDAHEASVSLTVFSEIAWNKLSPADQKLLSESFVESIVAYNKIRVEADKKVMDDLKAAGVVLTIPTDKADWIKAMDPLYKKYGADFGDLITQIQATK